MKIIKINQEKNHEVQYKNGFVDEVVLNLDKRLIITFFYLIYKFQNENAIEITISEMKKKMGLNREKMKVIDNLINKLYDQKVYYKNKELIETEDIRINVNDYIKDHLFDILVISNDKTTLKFVLKKRYVDYFKNLKNRFSTIKLENFKNLTSTEILIYIFLNRWKGYREEVESHWEIFKLNMGFSGGYRNNDIIRKLDKGLIKIEKETGIKTRYKLIKSKNKRKIEKIIFKINEVVRIIRKKTKYKK